MQQEENEDSDSDSHQRHIYSDFSGFRSRCGYIRYRSVNGSFYRDFVFVQRYGRRVPVNPVAAWFRNDIRSTRDRAVPGYTCAGIRRTPCREGGVT